jgi:gluconolactonase
MKCDERGNVWVSGRGGVWVYDPSGELIGMLHIPEGVANFAWGGTELRTLFLTAAHSVYRVTTKVGPRIEPCMRAHAAAMSAVAPAEAPAGLDLDPHRAVLIIQDMHNDAVSEGGAFAESGAPAHAKAQNVVENIRHVAAAARAHGVPVILSGSLSSRARPA